MKCLALHQAPAEAGSSFRRRKPAGWIGCAILLVLSLPAAAQNNTGEALRLSISVEQPTLTFPFPARVKLRLHNAGPETLWLYRHVRDPVALARSASGSADANQGEATTTGGSTLAVRLQPAVSLPNASGSTPASEPAPAEATVLESVGLPHPKLVKVLPGADYEETAVVQLRPARRSEPSGQESVWGDYHLSATYAAHFSNAAEIARNLRLTVWQGEVASDTLEIHVAAPPTAAVGSIEGTVLTPEGYPLRDMLTSLSDREERLVRQTQTDDAGRFLFTRLPLGFYWVTARRAESSVDTSTFQHAELPASAPVANMRLVMLRPEIYQSKQMLHKPVLVRITGPNGRPAPGVALEIVWSSGTVIENIKSETADDGAAALELLPGRSYVSLRGHGCPKQDARLDVAEGGGIDDAALTLECGAK